MRMSVEALAMGAAYVRETIAIGELRGEKKRALR